MIHKPAIQKLARIVGHAGTRVKSRRGGRYRTMWVCDSSGQYAIKALIALLPFLVVKKEQARLLIAFWNHQTEKTGKFLSAREIRYRRKLLKQMKQMKEEEWR
jgi:hypothetical protein